MTSKDRVVLVGGCFDILHPGHIIFLEKAKSLGDKLVVILESDEKVRKLKGPGRPIHTQIDRAMVLSALRCVDLVINLPFIETEAEYVSLISKIKPDIIATTKGLVDNTNKKTVAYQVGAKLEIIMDIIKEHSTTKIVSKDQFGG